MSIEQECQTTVEAENGNAFIPSVLPRFLRAMAGLAPSLPSARGFFNAYGRVYVDTNNHLELAAIECDSPYRLAQVVETQYELAGRAAAELESEGLALLLVNNNHCGLLEPGVASWGTHENYLIHRPALELADLALPFLVTRIYAGAGGICWPTAELVAGVRSLVMQADTGGGTTGGRAIYSTCREEHHQGPDPRGRRLHLIGGDGHRSQFNLALQVGATALALEAMQRDPDLPAQVRALRVRHEREGWVSALTRLNKLAAPGRAPQVHPTVVAVQSVYLEAARRTVAAMDAPPTWMSRLLDDWEETLTAYETSDLDWLSSRLDAFAKYQVFTHYLSETSRSWKRVAGDAQVQSELALLDHDYHTISRARSLFTDLEDDGLLRHRVAQPIVAGAESEPFVPDVATRARPRARFIKEHAGAREVDLVVHWDHVWERNTDRIRTLFDPFAVAFDDG